MNTSNDGCTTSNQILSQDDISAEMMSVASKLEPLLPITPEQRQLLLLKFSWDIESLKNSLQEYADMNSFLVENGVCPNDVVSLIYTSECEICCSTRKLIGLRCQHMACFNCWNKYLASKIRNNQCLLSCMELGCEILISKKVLGRFFCSSDLLTAHRKLIRDSYINSDSSLAWCNKKCGMAVRRSKSNTVACSCGSTFCFVCRSDAHYPATCLQFRLWERQRMDFGQNTSSWISSNTKECPRCFAPIQKNGGCNHMKCTSCRYEYCWVCSRNWKTHFASCKEWDIYMARSKSNFRGSSQLFAQHLTRFEHQKKCLEEDPRILTERKIQNTLDDCRRILMGSYVFGYYLKDGKYKSCFEKHQQKLEIAVKELALSKTGRRASNLAEECLSLRKAFLAHCDEGAEHENLEGPQPVKNASTSKHACVEFSGVMMFGICLIIVMILCGFLLIYCYTQP